MDVGGDGPVAGAFGVGDPVATAGQRFEVAAVGFTAARPGPGRGRHYLSRPQKWEPGCPGAQGGNSWKAGRQA
eukprot:5148614-Alexandrium_andersonii.AAC.1